MITNGQLFELAVFIADVEESGKRVKIHDFENLLKVNNLRKFKKELGLNEEFAGKQPTTRSAYEVDQRVTDILRRFKVNNAASTVTAGVLSLPADYFYVTRIGYDYSGERKTVEILTDAQWDGRLGNSITMPTLKNPVCRFLASSIDFRPVSITSVSWSYLRLPAEPTVIYKTENGVMVYDTSTELEWDEVAKIDILYMVLRDMGIHITPQRVTDYAQQITSMGA